jgi:hypothetical protein
VGSNKRKKQLATVQNDVVGKRRKTSKLLAESLEVPKEDSSPIDAIAVPNTIGSLHGKKRTPINISIAEAATSTASPDVVLCRPSLLLI